MAAYYARDYRDALARLARFKQLCTPEELQIKISKDECLIEPVWQHAQEETPPLLTDAAFASFVELGRRGTGHPVNPKRVELKRKAETTRVHEAYFKCPVKFGARRNTHFSRGNFGQLDALCLECLRNRAVDGQTHSFSLFAPLNENSSRRAGTPVALAVGLAPDRFHDPTGAGLELFEKIYVRHRAL